MNFIKHATLELAFTEGKCEVNFQFFFFFSTDRIPNSCNIVFFFWEKNQRGTFFAKTNSRGTFLLFLPLSISSSLRKLLLLHNLSRINTHDKFTLEDAVITEMIGSKLRIFFKSRDARYRSLARVVWACFCYNLVTFLLHISSTFPHIIAPCNGFSSHNLAKPSNVTYLFLLWSFACILTRIWGL